MSVAAQAGSFTLHHHVQDGGSNDGTSAILERWASMVEFGLLPPQCQKFTFSYAIESDDGMYDALVKGFAKHAGGPGDWLGWINADDILMPGAASTLAAVDRDLPAEDVNWVGGRVRVARDHLVIADHDRPLCAAVMQAGLCDGLHYDFAQQEGMFFRRGLWDRIDPDLDFGRFRAAGDWNLWRLFAQHAQVHQVSWPLGEFQSREGQKSGDRVAYYLEMEREAPFEERAAAMATLAETGAERCLLKNSWADPRLSVAVESVNSIIEGWAKGRQRVARRETFIREELPELQSVLINEVGGEGGAHEFGAGPIVPPTAVSGIVAHDGDWQFPAITEQHAFKKVVERLPEKSGVTYLAFPWATFIDLRNNFKDSSELQSRLDEMKLDIAENARVVTVCQHIHLKRIIGLMENLGVTDVFWPHAVRGETHIGNVRVHPFPLFPVQISENSPPLEKRKLLFSFIGAKPDRWYLTEVRTWILDFLSNDDRGLVSGREGWHYGKIVYDLQIKKVKSKDIGLVDNDASNQFKEILSDTVFALCPSGSGPNSIRLWEAIGAGAVPVVLADTWAPPGNQALWEEACVFCHEVPEDVRALPDRLEVMRQDAELMARKANALKQLWSLYGPDSFTTDIEALALDEANQRSATEVERRFGSGLGPSVKVHVYGRHGARTPLSYPALKSYFAGRIEFTSSPAGADILIVGFDLDLRENAEAILGFLRQSPRLQIVVMSEEPLWDTIWSTGWSERETRIKLKDQLVPITVLNHFTSNIFNFAKLPYYVTTRDSYSLNYARRLHDVSRFSPSERLRKWTQATTGLGIYAERREGQQYAFERPENEITGLCDYRTRFAASLSAKPGVILEGKGWTSEKPRQSLPDWHLDKLVSLDGCTRIASALENTHYPSYITEKLFDAYAVGAIPVYYASAGHRVRELADASSYLNVYGSSPQEAAERAQGFEPTQDTAEAWVETAQRLYRLFANPDTLCAERQRIANEIVGELVQVQQGCVELAT